MEEISYIVSRVEDIDSDESEDTKKELKKWIAEWKAYLPPKYGPMGGKVDTSTLLYPYGSNPDPKFQKRAWPVLTAMRNVDKTSRAIVIDTYGDPDETKSGED